jgi:hypothetical protein
MITTYAHTHIHVHTCIPHTTTSGEKFDLVSWNVQSLTEVYERVLIVALKQMIKKYMEEKNLYSY